MKKLLIFFVLTILTFASLYIICCIGLGWFYKFGSFENASKYNTVLLNLSYSYIAGYIFYVLITYLPFCLRKSKIRTIIKHKKVEMVKQVESNIQAFYTKEISNPLDIDADDLKKQILNSNMYDRSFYGKEIGIQSSIITLLKESRKVMLLLCEQILIYHDYMSEVEILLIEEIREAPFYRIIDCGPLEHPTTKIIVSSIQYKKEIFNQLSKIKSLSCKLVNT